MSSAITIRDNNYLRERLNELRKKSLALAKEAEELLSEVVESQTIQSSPAKQAVAKRNSRLNAHQ